MHSNSSKKGVQVLHHPKPLCRFSDFAVMFSHSLKPAEEGQELCHYLVKNAQTAKEEMDQISTTTSHTHSKFNNRFFSPSFIDRILLPNFTQV